MPYIKAMHRIRFRPGIRPRFRWEFTTLPLTPKLDLRGLLLREGRVGRKGKGKERRRESRGREGRKGKERMRGGKEKGKGRVASWLVGMDAPASVKLGERQEECLSRLKKL